jgi:hypothetical protein
MREPQLWQEEDLLDLIRNRHEENIELDYKRADALDSTDGKKTQISKDVSAFANSIGGTILYGMEEDPTEPHFATAVSPIDPRTYSKEWIEQVINSRIQPRISGILINPIELGHTAPGKFAYAVVVPESTTAHQASDKRYYKRFNFLSVPMEDYEIRQAMNRVSRPAYSVQIDRVGSATMTQSGGTAWALQGDVQNLTEIVGHDVSVVAFLPRCFVDHPDAYSVTFEGTPYTRMFSTYHDSSVWYSAIPSAHPLTPYRVNFVRHLCLPAGPHQASSIAAVVKVFDQFGLALRAKFIIKLPNFGVQLVEEIHAARRSPSALAAGRLD